MSTMQACLRALRAALADAGLEFDDIDGVSARWPGPGRNGVPARLGGLGEPARHPAALDRRHVPARRSGGHRRGDRDRGRAVRGGVIVGGQAGVLGGGKVAAYTRPDNEFISCWGSITQAQFALVAQVYFERYRPDRERLAGLAATIRNTGAAESRVRHVRAGPLHGRGRARPRVPDGRSPFHLLEVCLATEGAAATGADHGGDGA